MGSGLAITRFGVGRRRNLRVISRLQPPHRATDSGVVYSEIVGNLSHRINAGQEGSRHGLVSVRMGFGEGCERLGQRPPLDELGPFRWQPYTAPSWRASLSDGTEVHSFEFDGRPRLVIFYLGFGCLHCIEQLHAFSPRVADFEAAGIDMVAMSTESIDQLKTGMKDYEKPIAIPLMADPKHEAFKQFRCWDDFEDQPLHGTFLIDARGRVRWQDISHEPFTDVEFLLDEAKRLLELP